MLALIPHRIRKAGRFVKRAALLTAVVCTLGDARAVLAEEEQVLSGIQVSAEGDAALIQFSGIHGAPYTVEQKRDPDRLIVRFSGVRPQRLAEEIAVSEGPVKAISVSTFVTEAGRTETRLEVILSSNVNYEFEQKQDAVLLQVDPVVSTVVAGSGDAGGSELENETESAVWEDPRIEAGELQPAAPSSDAQPPAVRKTAPESEVVQSAAEPAPAKTKQLEGIQVETVDGRSVIRLQTRGGAAPFESFALEDPARLVVDLPGFVNGTAYQSLEVGSPHAEQIRLGQHAEKLRVVVDGGDVSKFPAFEVSADADDILIVIEETPSVAVNAATEDKAPAEAEPAPAAAVAPEIPSGDTALAAPPQEAAPEATTAAIHIRGIQFERTAEYDRIQLEADGELAYRLYEPDAETLILSFEGALLEPGAALNLTPEGEGPLSLLNSFQQPESKLPEARLVVRRAPALKPEIQRNGAVLIVKFVAVDTQASLPLVAELSAEGTAAQEKATAAQQATTTAQSASAPSVTVKNAEAVPVVANETTPVVISEIPAAGSIPETGSANELFPAALDLSGDNEPLLEGSFADDKLYTGRRISLDFKDVDINDVLRLIAEVSDLNIIAGDEVKGQVTIRLVEVPWDQALDVILLTKGLGFERIGNVLRIAPSELLKQEEEARLQERRAKEKLEDLVVKLQPVNYADVREMESMVKRLLTERGTVNTDKRTNTIIIKDIPSVIDESTALIKSIDTQTPQVLIESKIVEASLDYVRELGSQWGFGFQEFVDPFDDSSGPRQDGGRQGFRLHNEQRIFEGNDSGSNNIIVQNPITETATGLIDIGAFLLGGRYNLELMLQAAESNGEGRVISSPRVVTLDNRDATIEQGVSIPFQTFENGDAQLEFIDAVLSLNVKPHITADKSIIMKIEVTRNAPDDSVSTPTGSPAIAKNQATTETLVKDGQTLVIGGIYVVDSADRRSSVPYLWKLPIIGHAFRNTEVRDIRKELLIFVTPRIVVQAEPAG